jgi:indolepyruvate ferredoxin oxidoreductase beta subunit
VKYIGLEDIDWKQVIKDNVPEKFVDLNIQAYEKGYSI